MKISGFFYKFQMLIIIFYDLDNYGHMRFGKRGDEKFDDYGDYG